MKALLALLLLGPPGRRRRWVLRTLLGGGIYVTADAWRHAAVHFGYADGSEIDLLALCNCIAAATFYALTRSGWSERLADPGMTNAQCIAGFFSISASYVLIPELRGVQLVMVVSGLLFTAFMNKASDCYRMGAIGIVFNFCAVVCGAYAHPESFSVHAEMLNIFVALVAMPLVSMLAAQLSTARNVLKQQRKSLREMMDRIENMATTDELTRLPNRRHALELMNAAWSRADERRTSLSLGFVDLDHFKRINDTWGHAAGDRVLRIVTERLVGLMRAGDMLARWGGEEFLIILPATDLAGAQTVIDRLRLQLAGTATWAACPELEVSFSSGVAQRVGVELPFETLERADRALYCAKAGGRGRTVIDAHSAQCAAGEQAVPETRGP